MRVVRRVAFAPFLLVVATAVGCGGDSVTAPDPPPPNSVRLQSDPQDYIGQGRSYEYTSANAIITVMATGRHLTVAVDGDESWFADFEGPASATRLQVGTYGNLTRYPFHDTQRGGLSWSGEGRGCNTLTGSFTIDSVTYRGDTLTALDLRFEQHCEGGAAALRGTIHWRSDDRTRPAGPAAIPSTLWRPPPGATPASGDFVYLQSDAGDYIGGGATFLYTPLNASIVVTANGRHLSIGVGGWSGEFEAMNAVSRIEPGYYPDLIRWPFHNPAKGGLDWFGQGRGCNTLQGWFAVDRVTYVGSTLTALEMRFEQHCDGATPALRGAIRWRV
jgi:hypothetical protein